MGLLDGILGGVTGAAATSLVEGFIQQHGGVQGIVSQMESQGMGSTVRSWVGNGTNLPISADQLHQVFGSSVVQQLAAKAGLDPQQVAQHLSQLLPAAVDNATPGGVVPQQ